MIAILGGLGAACSWAIATVCSSRSSRMIGAASVLAWVMLVGLVVSAPIVAPIASTEGGIAAVLAVIAGERMAPGTGTLLCVIAVGVVLAGLVPEPDAGQAERRGGQATLYAVGAAVSFGASLYAAGRVSQELPLVWVVLPARVVGVVALTLPLALGRRCPRSERMPCSRSGWRGFSWSGSPRSWSAWPS